MAQLIEINQVGKREDLRDFISLADVKEKPLLAMLGKAEAPGNMLITWQADKYASTNTDGVADGVDVSEFENSAKDRATIQTYAQKFRRTAMVGDIAENVSNVAGAKGGELARALDKKMEEIGRDIETALGSDNECALETDKANPYKLRGLGKWIQSTAQAVLPVNSNFRTPAASIMNPSTAVTAIAEFGTYTLGTNSTSIQALLQSIYVTYGKRQNIPVVCGTNVKKLLTGFTQYSGGTDHKAATTIRAFNADLNGRKIVANVNVYEGDFNDIELHPSLLLPDQDRAYFIPDGFVDICWSRAPRIKQLPDLGGGPRAYIDAILALLVKNPTVLGKIDPT